MVSSFTFQGLFVSTASTLLNFNLFSKFGKHNMSLNEWILTRRRVFLLSKRPQFNVNEYFLFLPLNALLRNKNPFCYGFYMEREILIRILISIFRGFQIGFCHVKRAAESLTDCVIPWGFIHYSSRREVLLSKGLILQYPFFFGHFLFKLGWRAGCCGRGVPFFYVILAINSLWTTWKLTMRLLWCKSEIKHLCIL